LLVTIDTNVVGLPGGNAMNVAAVGPMVESGMVAVADRSGGIMQGIRYGASTEIEPATNIASDSSSAEVVASAASDKATPQTVKVINHRDPEALSLGADRRALAQAEWLVKLGLGIGEQFGISRMLTNDSGEPVVNPRIESPDLLAKVSKDADREAREAPVVTNSGRLDSGLPVGALVIAAVSYQMRRPLRRWWRARHDIPRAPRGEQLPLGQGPHHRFYAGSRERSQSDSYSQTTVRRP
jgi:hypothetical protein